MAQSNAQLRATEPATGMAARITSDPREIRQALELRYRVFAEDMGETFRAQTWASIKIASMTSACT